MVLALLDRDWYKEDKHVDCICCFELALLSDSVVKFGHDVWQLIERQIAEEYANTVVGKHRQHDQQQTKSRVRVRIIQYLRRDKQNNSGVADRPVEPKVCRKTVLG